MTALQQELLSGTWQADPVHSSVQFAVRHMGVSTFEASYDDVEALLVREDSGRRPEGVARVESVSITNPPGFREHVVRGKDFLDADRHPEITFRSAEVLIGEDGGLVVEGDLTVKGISRGIAATGTFQAPVAPEYNASIPAR